MILSKGITLLEQTATFNNDIREWRQQPSELKTWAGFKIFFHCAHREQRHVVTTSGKGGYMAEVQNIYVMLTPAPPEEHMQKLSHYVTSQKECKTKYLRWTNLHKWTQYYLQQTLLSWRNWSN